MCVAIPVPEPEWVRLENAVSENSIGSSSCVGIEQKPEQLFVVSLRGKIRRACLFNLLPGLIYDFLVVINRVLSTVSAELFFHGVSQVHDGVRQFFLVQNAVGFNCV